MWKLIKNIPVIFGINYNVFGQKLFEMNVNTSVRTKLADLADQISTLAQKTSKELVKNKSVLELANQLIDTTISFTFHLGELYATEKENAIVSAPRVVKGSNIRYHNVRDNRGRFKSI